MAYIVPMHVKPKFTYLLTYLTLQDYSQMIPIKCHQICPGHIELIIFTQYIHFVCVSIHYYPLISLKCFILTESTGFEIVIWKIAWSYGE